MSQHFCPGHLIIDNRYYVYQGEREQLTWKKPFALTSCHEEMRLKLIHITYVVTTPESSVDHLPMPISKGQCQIQTLR